MTQLWIGTYPSAGAGTPVGRGEGIWSVDLDDATGVLSDARQLVVTPAPSFVATDPDGRVLYAGNEHADGAVTTFEVTGDGLVEGGTRPSGGDDPCHLLVDGDRLLVANYSSGTLAVIERTDDALAPGGQVFGHEGGGPVADRQDGPHAHFVAVAPGGAHVLVVDLGTDELRRYARTDDGLRPDGLRPDGIAATLPAGTGPRHLAFSADGRFAYVVGELDVAVHVLAWDVATATGTLVQSVPAVAGQVAGPVTPQGPALPSHVVLDGGDLFVGVRGADVLTRWRVGADGLLTDGRSVPLGGRWPRHFAVVGRWVVAGLEKSDELVVLDRAWGDGEAVVARLPLPAPTCVLPRP